MQSVPLETLNISVHPSPETNDHEVRLFSEEGDLIERFANDAMGLDPDDLLVEPCPLMPAESPRTVLIGRCGCGVIGCGPVHVTISTDGSTVSWTTAVRTTGVRFAAAPYLAEVQRALSDRAWETPDRSASRLIKSTVDRQRLAEVGFEFAWASGRVRKNVMTLAVVDPGGAQVLVHVPWLGESPEAIAETCRQLLLGSPAQWHRMER